MLRLPRIALLVALVAIMPVLAGCENFDPDSLDPFGLNKKKPLPGKRELLFPNGVPGVSQGIPPEYRAGYKPLGSEDLPPGDIDGKPAAAGTAAAPAAQTAKRAPVEPVRQSNLTKPKPKAKPHRVVRRKPKPKPKPTETATQPQGTQAPWPSQQPPPQQTQSGWPAPQQDQKLAPWPSAPPSGTFSK